MALPALPAASLAVTVRIFVPGRRAMPPAVQLVLATAVPLPPWLLTQVTSVTPSSSEAVPARVSVLLPVLKAGSVAGEVMVTVGGVASAGSGRATPLTRVEQGLSLPLAS